MSQTVELSQGEVKIRFSSPSAGKLSFSDLGLSDDDLVFEGGLLRLVFDFEGIGEHHYYSVPTLAIAYQEDMAETHWQCEFNKEVIVDKTDHHGHSTVITLNREKLSTLEHHHENALIVHAQFPQGVHIRADESSINFFK
ncbi:MAG: hypothetical protein ACI8W8_003910 [Rhodothermales bacterium]|jgi:hypothetical protein